MTEHHTAPAKPSTTEHETLRAIVGHIIPADPASGNPGADDPEIFADIARALDKDGGTLRAAIAAVIELAGDGFPGLPEEEKASVLQRFRVQQPLLAQACEIVAARCYYRDARIMAAIGMEVRPPFPLGFRVEQGDWNLLEPVRRRGKIYRETQ